VAVLNQQIRASEAQLSNFDQQVLTTEENSSNQNNGILSERKPLEVRIAQINDQISRAKILAPIDGNVLVKYMKDDEIATIGKPIMKVAKNGSMILRTYITSSQLAGIKLHQKVAVFTGKDKNQKQYTGDITWISPKAEFTPKTIQTVDERENLVYAVKVNIPNDGYLKIGMYGDIKLK
jgi:HlyD family secretion protein